MPNTYPALYCYEVVDGMIKEYNTLEDGRRQVAEFYCAGDVFGISETEEQLHTAEAVTDCAVRRYPRDAYFRQIARSPALSLQFLDTVIKRLHNARERIILLGRMNASQRVAAFLLRLSDEQDSARDIQIVMSRQDIADHLGLTTETVCRSLTALKKRGVIEMSNPRSFDVPNLAALDIAAHSTATAHH
ncbi:MAG: helix-turn-helix domain-containing protein [Pseudomonadota bacterium]